MQSFQLLLRLTQLVRNGLASYLPNPYRWIGIEPESYNILWTDIGTSGLSCKAEY